MMKRIVSVISIAVLLLMILVWPYLVVFKKSCKIQDLSMSLTIPGNGFMLTRSVDRGGLPVDLYKLLKGIDVNDAFKKNDIYLTVNYGEFEVQVDAFQDYGTAMLFDLDRLTDAELQEVVQSFAEQYQGDKVSTYIVNGYKYIMVEYQNKKIGDSYTTKAYMTIKNGKLINIALLCPDKQISAERASKLQQIVDSIKYTNSK